MSISLYRKYRPQDFSSVVGQKSAVDVITNSITKSRVGHAYLFSGSRGCGKTSVARIFAKALNCLDRHEFEPCGICKNCTAITAGESLDVIEIDGASNNSVDEIRELKANVTLAPFSSKYKVYIIDEVHMLSTAAFNALLKTLEEPPEYVVFILATTEPHKVPVTIRSRCQHIPFHSISTEDIYARLNEVCALENVSAQSEALYEISRQADGALRDALSLLEQVIAAGEVTLQNVEATFGAGSRPAFERWIKLLRENLDQAYINLKAMFDAGASGVRVFEEMFSIVRNLWLVSRWNNITESLGISDQEKKFLHDEAKNWKPEKLHTLLNITLKTLTQAKTGTRPDILLGMFMLYLEGNASNTQPVKIPAQPQILSVTRISQPVRDTKPDNALKELLLNRAHEKNFIVYCAIYDADVHEHDKSLILSMQHKYCYEVLRQDRNAAALTLIAGSYEHVILRHNDAVYTCPAFHANVNTESIPVQTKQEPEIITPEVVNDSEPEKVAHSAFESMIYELKKLSRNSEVIFMKHIESEGDSSIDDDTEGESE